MNKSNDRIGGTTSDIKHYCVCWVSSQKLRMTILIYSLQFRHHSTFAFDKVLVIKVLWLNYLKVITKQKPFLGQFLTKQ